MLTRLSPTTFASATAQGTIAVLFTAPWCDACKQQEPMLEQLDWQRADVQAFAVDIEQAPALGEQFSVELLPTILVFVNGQALGRGEGLFDAAGLGQLVADAREAATWDRGAPPARPPPPGVPPARTVPPAMPPTTDLPVKGAGAGAGALALLVIGGALLFARRRR